MKSNAIFVLAFFGLVAVAVAAPLDDSKNAQILRYDSDNIGVDGYKFDFETSDGTSQQQEGHLNNVGTEDEAISVRGSVTWVGADGQTYHLTYVADENGYQPEGAHLPHN